ncbi:MAG: FAD-dependent thymidylate synthase [Actinomycetia bacterium]|nr:FAD-dependent thymidylate synthase [Actinomycetes bacterium]
MLNRKVSVLDKGYVRLIDVMGSDLTAVNAARASYMKESETLQGRDVRLLEYLIREGHTSPFRHAVVSFEIKAPLMVARQLFKYRVGHKHGPDSAELLGTAIPADLKDFVRTYLEEVLGFVGLGDDYGGEDSLYARNEASRRYVTLEPEFYIPAIDQWRGAPGPGQSKQGSNGAIPAYQGGWLTARLAARVEEALEDYHEALKLGVAPEQARLFLPMYALYTTWRWTASLQGVLWLLEQRLGQDAQSETRQYAQAIRDLVTPYFPHTFTLWSGGRLNE